MIYLRKHYGLMREHIVYNVENNAGEPAEGKDNVLKSEWIALFPSVHTIKIRTRGEIYKFRLEELLESIRSFPRTVTVIVEDRGEWAKKAVTAEISGAFEAAGWDLEFVEDHIGSLGGEESALYIKSKSK